MCNRYLHRTKTTANKKRHESTTTTYRADNAQVRGGGEQQKPPTTAVPDKHNNPNHQDNHASFIKKPSALQKNNTVPPGTGSKTASRNYAYPMRVAMSWTSRASPISAKIAPLSRCLVVRRCWCTAPTARSEGTGRRSGPAKRSDRITA